MLYNKLNLKKNMIFFAHQMYKNHWVANHDGNISVKMHDKNLFLATPGSKSKGMLNVSDLVVVDINGNVKNGLKRIFSEWVLHISCYNVNRMIKAVVHAHPPYVTAFSVSNKSIHVPVMPEVIVSLGKTIPIISNDILNNMLYKRDVYIALEKLRASAMIIEANGALTIGKNIEQAYLRMELLEHYAKILYLSQLFGGGVSMSDNNINMLMKKYKQY